MVIYKFPVFLAMEHILEDMGWFCVWFMRIKLDTKESWCCLFDNHLQYISHCFDSSFYWWIVCNAFYWPHLNKMQQKETVTNMLNFFFKEINNFIHKMNVDVSLIMIYKHKQPRGRVTEKVNYVCFTSKVIIQLGFVKSSPQLIRSPLPFLL